MVSREFVARPCVLESELGGIENGRRYSDDDLCPSRFVGSRQVVEHTTRLKSRAIAWEYASAYFGMEAKYSECDRYAVDTYWAY